VYICIKYYRQYSCRKYYIHIELATIPSRCVWYRWYLIVRNHNTALPSTTFVESRNLQNSPAADGVARMRVMRERRTCIEQHRDRFSNVNPWILLSIVRRWIKHSSHLGIESNSCYSLRTLWSHSFLSLLSQNSFDFADHKFFFCQFYAKNFNHFLKFFSHLHELHLFIW